MRPLIGFFDIHHPHKISVVIENNGFTVYLELLHDTTIWLLHIYLSISYHDVMMLPQHLRGKAHGGNSKMH